MKPKFSTAKSLHSFSKSMFLAKRSFNNDAIVENAEHIIKAVTHARPAQVKGKFLKNIFISTTMGPGIKLDLTAFSV